MNVIRIYNGVKMPQMALRAMLVVLFVTSAQFTWAQADIGKFAFTVKVGVNRAAMYDVDNKLGYLAGVELQRRFTKHHAASIGVYLNKFKVDHHVDIDLNYVTVPIMYDFYIVKGLCLKVGVEGSLLVHDNAHGMYQGCRFNTSYERFLEHLASDTKTVKVNKMRYAIPFGISYGFSSFVVGAYIEHGLTDVSGFDKIHYTMNGLYATLGIKM